jgi:hypothetical protein
LREIILGDLFQSIGCGIGAGITLSLAVGYCMPKNKNNKKSNGNMKKLLMEIDSKINI